MTSLLHLSSISTPRPLSLLPENSTDRPPSPRNFVSEMVAIVQKNALTQRYDLLDVQLALLASEAPPEAISAETLLKLTQEVKEIGELRGQLPTIYRHLIADFHIQDQGTFLNNPLFASFSEEFRVECAKMDLKKNVGQFSAHLPEYGIQSQSALIELAELAAEEGGWAVCKYAQNYQVVDTDFLLKIVKSIAQFNGHCVAMYITNFNFSEEARTEIAKQLAQSDPESLAQFFDYFDITTAAVRAELACSIAKVNGKIACEWIENFNIGVDSRIEVAKLAIQSAPASVAELFINFSIASQPARAELARALAHVDGKAVSQFIGNFNLMDPSLLYSIAVIAARQNGKGVSQYIAGFQCNETRRIAIAKIAMKQDPVGFCEFFENYKISSEQVRIELAKYTAEYVHLFPLFLVNFNISDQKALIELALITTNRSGFEISICMSYYCIVSEKVRLDIACLAAKNNPRAVLTYLARYDLKSVQSRLKLFEVLIQTGIDPAEMVLVLFPDTMSVPDQSIALAAYPELRAVGFPPNADSFPKFLNSLFVYWEVEQVPASVVSVFNLEYTAFCKEENAAKKATQARFLSLYQSVYDYAHQTPALMTALSKILDSIRKEKNLHVKEQKIQWTAQFFIKCRIEKIEPAQLLDRAPVLQALEDLRDPSLRTAFLNYFIRSFEQPHPKCRPHQHLFLMLLGTFVNPTIAEITSNNFFKDKERTKSLLRSLYPFMETKELSNEEKIGILNKLVFVKNDTVTKDKQAAYTLFAMQMVAQLIEGGQAKRLTELHSQAQLQVALNEILTKALELEVTDFNTKYLSTFGNWRKPGSFLIYVGKILTLPESDHQNKLVPLLKTYATAVLENTFSTVRYDIRDSEHLEKLHAHSQELLTRWKQGYTKASDTYEIVDTDNPCDLLLSGTEVGSCQSVDKEPFYSKCLTNYLLDGKVRMMAIKNKNGVILTRCMLRLLWDQKTQQFALFKEYSYPKESNTTLKSLLDAACVERAAQLGVSLLEKRDAPSLDNSTTLQSFRTNTPFEYVDALGSAEEPFLAIKTDTGYEIPDCHYIYHHNLI